MRLKPLWVSRSADYLPPGIFFLNTFHLIDFSGRNHNIEASQSLVPTHAFKLLESIRLGFFFVVFCFFFTDSGSSSALVPQINAEIMSLTAVGEKGLGIRVWLP